MGNKIARQMPAIERLLQCDDVKVRRRELTSSLLLTSLHTMKISNTYNNVKGQRQDECPLFLTTCGKNQGQCCFISGIEIPALTRKSKGEFPAPPPPTMESCGCMFFSFLDSSYSS
jgi:hypothetical protein